MLIFWDICLHKLKIQKTSAQRMYDEVETQCSINKRLITVANNVPLHAASAFIDQHKEDCWIFTRLVAFGVKPNFLVAVTLLMASASSSQRHICGLTNNPSDSSTASCVRHICALPVILKLWLTTCCNFLLSTVAPKCLQFWAKA